MDHVANAALNEPPKAADPAWFEQLYLDAREDVYAYVASVLRDRNAAEDVTAASFEKAYRKRRSYKPSKGTHRAWLFGIARNAALDELRRRKRSLPLAGDPADLEVASPIESSDQALRRTTVREALAQLTPKERELIALKFQGGLTNAELASVLGVSESNAGTLLHRTVTKLRKACDETIA